MTLEHPLCRQAGALGAGRVGFQIKEPNHLAVDLRQLMTIGREPRAHAAATDRPFGTQVEGAFELDQVPDAHGVEVAHGDHSPAVGREAGAHHGALVAAQGAQQPAIDAPQARQAVQARGQQAGAVWRKAEVLRRRRPGPRSAGWRRLEKS